MSTLQKLSKFFLPVVCFLFFSIPFVRAEEIEFPDYQVSIDNSGAVRNLRIRGKTVQAGTFCALAGEPYFEDGKSHYILQYTRLRDAKVKISTGDNSKKVFSEGIIVTPEGKKLLFFEEALSFSSSGIIHVQYDMEFLTTNRWRGIFTNVALSLDFFKGNRFFFNLSDGKSKKGIILEEKDKGERTPKIQSANFEVPWGGLSFEAGDETRGEFWEWRKQSTPPTDRFNFRVYTTLPINKQYEVEAGTKRKISFSINLFAESPSFEVDEENIGEGKAVAYQIKPLREIWTKNLTESECLLRAMGLSPEFTVVNNSDKKIELRVKIENVLKDIEMVPELLHVRREAPTVISFPVNIAPEEQKTISISPRVKNPKRFNFLIMGDFTSGEDFDICKYSVSMANSIEPLFTIHLGDYIHMWEWEWEKRAIPVMKTYEMPVMTVRGNHEPSLPDYKYYFGFSQYSFEYGGIRFVIIDLAKGTVDTVWLEKQLKKKPSSEFTVVCGHIPPIAPSFNPSFKGWEKWKEHSWETPWGGLRLQKSEELKLKTLFKKYEVDMAFFGHNHMYYRTEEEGMTYTISGGAGGYLTADSEDGGFYHMIPITVTRDGKKLKVEDKMVKLEPWLFESEASYEPFALEFKLGNKIVSFIKDGRFKIIGKGLMEGQNLIRFTPFLYTKKGQTAHPQGFSGYPKKVQGDKWEFGGEMKELKSEIPFVYTQTVEKTGNSIRFDYLIEPKGEVDLTQFFLYLKLPISFFAGEKVKMGEEKIMFPRENQREKSLLFGGEVKKVIVAPDSDREIIIDCDYHTYFELWDNRMWNDPTYGLRIMASGGRNRKVSPGDELKLGFSLSVK